MTTMIDTSGNEHEIARPDNVQTFRSIGWTVKGATDLRDQTTRKVPVTEHDWDHLFRE